MPALLSAPPVTRSSRPFLYLLLAAALFVRALVPQGYMPERADSGAVAVVMCGSGGVHLIPLKQDREAPGKSQRAEPPCAFAGLAAPALPPPAAPELLPTTLAAMAYAEERAFDTRLAATRLHPPARGPPLAA